MNFLFFIILILTSCTPVITPSSRQSNLDNSLSPTLPIIIADIGQGNSTVILTGDNKAILFDSGPPDSGTEVLVPLLQSHDIESITLFVTHFDADHMGNVNELKEAGFEIETYDRGSDPLDPTYLDYVYLNLFETGRNTFEAGSIYQINEKASLTCLVSDGRYADGTVVENDLDENERSLGLVLTYGSFKMFIGGDLTGGGNETIDMETHTAELSGAVDVLVVNHHGSNTSSNAAFLDTLGPKVSIISVGANAYGHPNPNVMDRLYNSGTIIYMTEKGSLEDASRVKVMEDDINIYAYPDGSFEVEGDLY